MEPRNVLFVDDEVNILSSLKRELIDEEFHCFFASSGKEALKIMEDNVISVIVSDMRMPEMDGLTLLKIVKEKYPKTIRIVLSGYMQLSQILTTVNQADIFKFITKPWNYENELLQILRQAIEYYNSQEEREKLREELKQRNIAYKNILKKMDNGFNSKKILDLIRNVSILSFNCLDNWVKTLMPGCDDDTFDRIKELYLEYLDTIVTDEKDFMLKKVFEEIVTYLETKSFTNIDVKYTVDDEYMVKGNYTLYLLVFKAFFLTFLQKDSGQIKISAEIKQDKKECDYLECVFMLSNSYCNTMEKSIMEQRCAFLTDYLTEVMKNIKGSFKIGQVENNIAAKYRIEFTNNNYK